jgi:hypothetical protein
MKKLLSAIFLLQALLLGAQQPQGLTAVSRDNSGSYVTESKSNPKGGPKWQEVSNDPTHTRFYTLENGLTVILSENHLEPKVMALITTKAGSKNDPHDHTGLAHYLEHMLFKGTDKFGSLDWGKESAELDKIDALYEKYNHTRPRSRLYALGNLGRRIYPCSIPPNDRCLLGCGYHCF